MDQIKLDNSERTRCEVWTRVMGYFRPVSNFNIGKKGEFYQRKPFTEGAARAHDAMRSKGFKPHSQPAG